MSTATAMKFYYHPASTASRPVLLFAAESGIALDLQLVDIFKGEHHQPAYTALNPKALVPMLETRHEAGLTQSQVAERMGTQPPAVARLEHALATGKHSPSIATLRKYAKACGRRLLLEPA